MTSPDELETMRSLALLAGRARVDRPRLFAMYGLDGEGREILGWGMEFEKRGDALFYQPAGPVTHHTVSAERLAQRYAQVADVHLTWFDESDE